MTTKETENEEQETIRNKREVHETQNKTWVESNMDKPNSLV